MVQLERRRRALRDERGVGGDIDAESGRRLQRISRGQQQQQQCDAALATRTLADIDHVHGDASRRVYAPDTSAAAEICLRIRIRTAKPACAAPASRSGAQAKGVRKRRALTRGTVLGALLLSAAGFLFTTSFSTASAALNVISLERESTVVRIVFAAPLAAWRFGSEKSSYRLGIIAYRKAATSTSLKGGLEPFFCEFSLELDRCVTSIALPALSGTLTSASFSSFTPFGARNDLLEPPTTDDESQHRFCERENWLAGNFPVLPAELAGCIGGLWNRTTVINDDEEEEHSCKDEAGFYNWLPACRAPASLSQMKSEDPRWRSYVWERLLFLFTLGMGDQSLGFQRSCAPHWMGALGSVYVLSANATKTTTVLAAPSLYTVHAEALSYWSGVLDAPSPNGLQGVYPVDTARSLGCPSFRDESIVLVDPSDPRAADKSGKRVMQSQVFALWNRGVVYFASMYEYDSARELQRVVPRARLCTVNVTADLPLDTGLLVREGSGFTAADGGILYRGSDDPWPQAEDGVVFFNDPLYPSASRFIPQYDSPGLGSLPPHASVLAVAVDPPAEPGDAILYHVLLRTPLFPTQGQDGDAEIAGHQMRCSKWVAGETLDRDDPLFSARCGSLEVEHVFAVYSFRVRFGLDPSADPATGAGARLERPPLVLKRWQLPWASNWIIQNERPTVAGPGVGLMECKLAEGDGLYSFVVCPDEIIRLRRPRLGFSGLGGEVEARVPSCGPADCVQFNSSNPPSASLVRWRSVPAAVYSKGALYYALEEHTDDDTEGLSMDPYDEYFGAEPGRRLSGDASRAPFSRLYHVPNADAPVMKTGRPAFKLPGGVRGGYAFTDYSRADRAFEYLEETGVQPDPSMLTPANFIAFWADSLPSVIRIYIDCAPGTVFNELTLSNPATSDCLKLPSGSVSSSYGLLSSDHAEICPAGAYAAPSRTECLLCPAGFHSEVGASSCYPCPQNTYKVHQGEEGCIPCQNNSYTQTSGWSTACVVCSPGTFLPYPGATVCLRCSSTQVSSWGATECTDCPPGTAAAPNSQLCLPCPSGTARRNGTSCERCPLGFNAPNAGASQCQRCNQGSVSADDRTSCLLCPRGTYHVEEENACRACPAEVDAYAPAGTARRCLRCPAGSLAASDKGGCLPCRAGTYRSENATACTACPPGLYSEEPGSAYCTSCPAGYEAATDRQSCTMCPAGAAREGAQPSCTPCDGRSIAPAAGSATCQRCPAGHVARGGRCVPCQASTFLAANASECQRCPPNSYSAEAATQCTPCEAGYESNEGQTGCGPCPAGTFRNATTLFCEACPQGSYAPAAASLSCLACSEAQFCPVATVTPIEKNLIRKPSVVIAASRRRWLLGRALLGSGEGKAPDLQRSVFAAGTTTGTVTMPEIKTEDDVQSRVYLLFGLIGAAVALAMIMYGLFIHFYLHVRTGDRERRIKRFKRILRLHLLFLPPENPSAGQASTGADKANEDADRWAGRRVSGSFFTALAVALVFVAVSFVLVQFAIANFQIIQCARAQSGTSPSAEDIAGRFAVSAAFPGYQGPCVAAGSASAAASAADAAVAVVGFAGSVSVRAAKQDGGLACNVTWECTACRLVSSSNVSVTITLQARLALSFGADFDIQLPQWVSAQGSVATTGPEKVFRGQYPVVLPVSFVGTHFSSRQDGSPRFSMAVASADNRPAERDSSSFTLCPAGRALERCEEGRVVFAAAFEVAQVYHHVRRTQKASVLDMLANLVALSSGAVAGVGNLLLVYAFFQGYLRRRHGLRALETLSDVGRDADDAVAIGPPAPRRLSLSREAARAKSVPPPDPKSTLTSERPLAPDRVRPRSAPRHLAPDPPPLVPSPTPSSAASGSSSRSRARLKSLAVDPAVHSSNAEPAPGAVAAAARAPEGDAFSSFWRGEAPPPPPSAGVLHKIFLI